MDTAPRRRTGLTVTLGLTQIVAWGGSYYLPAILVRPMAAELGAGEVAVMGGFSAALLLNALLGPLVGGLIDRRGGRDMLVLSNLVLAAGLVGLAAARNLPELYLGWAVLGAGMSMGLYETAFATLAALHGRGARGAITGVTLIGGFTSTLAWPLSTLMAAGLGWRGACLAWAALQVLLGVPLNRLLVPGRAPPPAAGAAPPAPARPAPRGAMPILGFFLAATSFVAGALTAHMPALIETAGAGSAAALLAASLIGPAQVLARVADLALMRRLHPVWTGRVAGALQIAGLGLLLLGGAAAIPFAVLYGAGNGLNTIARGTLPLAVFGPAGFGARQGWLALPARLAQAAAPVAFGVLLAWSGPGALWLAVGLCAAAIAALFALRPPVEEAAAAPPRSGPG